MKILLWFYFVPSLNRSRKTVTGSPDLSINEKNKALEDGQNNNVEPAVYMSG